MSSHKPSPPLSPEAQAEEQLDAQLLEGLSSAESELTPEDWCAIREEALAKIEARKRLR